MKVYSDKSERYIPTFGEATKALVEMQVEGDDRMICADDRSCSEDDFSSDDYSDESSYDSEWSAEMEDVQNSVPSFHKSSSSPALIALNLPMRQTLLNTEEKKISIKRSESTPIICRGMPASLLARIQKAELVIGNNYEEVTSVQGNPKPETQIVPKLRTESPNDVLSRLLEAKGINADSIPTEDINGFFLQMTDESKNGYDMAKSTAVRTEDIDFLRRMLQEGQTLQVCNQFGESIVHAVCRRNSYSVLEFLLNEAKISVKVVDDFGRTPMHDACWTNKPNFDAVKLILSSCPDLILIADKRGFSPLQYVPKDLWEEWCQFLEENQCMLMPRELVRQLS